jgi:flagellar biosynthesis protein FliP
MLRPSRINALCLGCIVGIIILTVGVQPALAAGGLALPTLQLGVETANSPEQVAQGVQILILLTVLTLAPSLW